MSENPKAQAILRRLLETTREEELDCDRFLALLPTLLDGRIEDASRTARASRPAVRRVR